MPNEPLIAFSLDSALRVAMEEGGRVAVRAEYFVGQIDLKGLRASLARLPILHRDPLVLEPQAGSYVVIFKFGSVVFWSCPQALVDELLDHVRGLPNAGALHEKIRDQIDVRLNSEADSVTFNDVSLRKLTLEHLKIISMALAQSVALENFEIEVGEALAKATPLVDELKNRGKLSVSERQILQTVGFAHSIRNAVLANLTLFDDPPETWQSESLSHLDHQLYDHFDLEERLSAINQKTQFLSDFNLTLMNILQTHKSHRLEWIIIILIFIEIIFFAWMELWPK